MCRRRAGLALSPHLSPFWLSSLQRATREKVQVAAVGWAACARGSQDVAPSLQGCAGSQGSSGHPNRRFLVLGLCSAPWHPSQGGSGWELVTPGRNLCRQLSSRGDLAVVVRGWYPSLPLCPHPAGIPSCCSKFGIAPMSAGVVPEASCGFCLTPSLESLPVPFSTPPRTWLWPCKAMRAEEEEEEAVEDVSHGGAALAPLLPALPLLWGSCQEQSGAGSCCSTERARGLLRELLVAPTSVSRPWM